MEIKYKNTLDEYIYLCLYLDNHNSWVRFSNNIPSYKYQTLLLILAIVSIILDITIIEKMIILSFLIVVWFIWIFIYPKTKKRRIIKGLKKQIKKDPSLLKEKTLILGTDKISIKSEKKNVDILFETFDKIIEDERYIIIITKKNNPKFIISNKFFKDEKIKTDFLNYIKSTAHV